MTWQFWSDVLAQFHRHAPQGYFPTASSSPSSSSAALLVVARPEGQPQGRRRRPSPATEAKPHAEEAADASQETPHRPPGATPQDSATPRPRRCGTRDVGDRQGSQPPGPGCQTRPCSRGRDADGGRGGGGRRRTVRIEYYLVEPECKVNCKQPGSFSTLQWLQSAVNLDKITNNEEKAY